MRGRAIDSLALAIQWGPCVWLCLSGLAAHGAVVLEPSHSSPWQVGGVVTWTATPSGGATDSYWYRFRARRVGLQHRGERRRRLAERGLGVANHHPAKALREERFVVESVAGHQYLIGLDVQVFGESSKRAPLGDTPREDVEVAPRREEHIAIEMREPAAHLVHESRVVEEEGAAALLGHALALHAGEPAQRARHRLRADPTLVDLPLYGLHGLQTVAVNHGCANIGDDEFRVGNEWIAEQRENCLHAAPGHEGESDLRVVAEEAVEGEAVCLPSAQEGSVEISCQK